MVNFEVICLEISQLSNDYVIVVRSGCLSTLGSDFCTSHAYVNYTQLVYHHFGSIRRGIFIQHYRLHVETRMVSDRSICVESRNLS